MIENQKEIMGIEIQESYRYLGVIIDYKGNIEKQLTKINQRANYLRVILKKTKNELTFEN